MSVVLGLAGLLDCPTLPCLALPCHPPWPERGRKSGKDLGWSRIVGAEKEGWEDGQTDGVDHDGMKDGKGE
ncbi:uncharacterized protein BKA78DRAFT_328445 [Phyllosticta capitalensis]|uniref:uncharacterized protein n=1 Tax=Phyllosticta capitalensis TaxID=121624 RepID=UPI00313117E2